jgi:hypothetical protein
LKLETGRQLWKGDPSELEKLDNSIKKQKESLKTMQSILAAKQAKAKK